MDHDLICLEATKINRAFEDPVLLEDDRVLRSLLLSEDKYVPQSCYFSCVQTDIRPFMRKMVADWMAEVCQEQKTEEEVFPLAMNYVDRFLCVQNLPRTRLQCLGAACMLLASKLKDNLHMATEQLVRYTDRSVTNVDIMELESRILHVLKWDLSAITPNDFLAHIARRLPLETCNVPSIMKHSVSFIHICAADCKFMLYPPSMIAAGCVAATIRGLRMTCPHITEHLHKITGIELECLRACQESIEQVIRVQLETLVREHDGSGSEVKALQSIVSQSTTPTDVRDVNLMAIDEENQFHME